MQALFEAEVVRNAIDSLNDKMPRAPGISLADSDRLYACPDLLLDARVKAEQRPNEGEIEVDQRLTEGEISPREEAAQGVRAHKALRPDRCDGASLDR